MPKGRVAFPWPLEQMRNMYETSQMTLEAIAQELSSDRWQAYWKNAIGREYRPNQKIVNKVCKRAGFAMRKTGAPGARNGMWNNGRTVDKGGYVLVKCPDHPAANSGGYVREHRLIAEKILGRYLTDTEVVHHRDDDPGNNDPSNLFVYETNGKHLAETLKGKLSPLRKERIAEYQSERRRRQAEGLPPLAKGQLKKERDAKRSKQKTRRSKASRAPEA